MIYIRLTDGTSVLIVEPTNLDRLRSGKPMVTPDRTIMIMYTPDMKFTECALQDMLTTGQIDTKTLQDVMDISIKREVVRR